MSQAGIVDIEGTHPQIPTLFVCNVGSAVPIANVLEILGQAVAAHGVPLQTVGSGNTVEIDVQYASAAASSVAANAGVASFDSTVFTVDANGFVTLSAVAGATKMGVDAFTAPGTNPVTPNGSGVITVTGGQVAAGTTANVIQTNSLAANTYTIQIQRSSAQASSTVGANGVSHFNSAFFTVDSNGFVSINGSAIGETITGNTGGALSPTAGNWNILGTSTAAGTTPVQTAGSGSTLTVQVQKAQAIASTNATNVGLAAFNSTYFTVDANGFVSINGAAIGETITGNTGGALAPTAGNWNILGTSTAAGTTPVQTSGTGSTLTVQVQKAQAIASTNATNVGLAAFDSTDFAVDANGFVTLNGGGAGQTITGNTGGALSPTAGNWNILGTGSLTTSGAVSTLTVSLTGLTNHAVLVGAGTATITKVGPSSTQGALFIGNGASADPGYSTVASMDDSIAVFSVSTAINTGGPQSALQNTSTTVGATARTIIAVSADGTGSDAYTLYVAGSGSGNAWEHGLQGSAKHYIFQYSPANSNPYMDGTTILDLHPNGNVTQPNQYYFSAAVQTTTTNQTGDGTGYIVIFNQVFNNVGSGYNGTTGIFTAPDTCTYIFSSVVLVNNLGALHTQGDYNFNFNNGSFFVTPTDLNLAAIRTAVGGDSNNASVGGTMQIALSAGDTVKMQLNVNGSTKTVGVFGTGRYSWFMGRVMG